MCRTCGRGKLLGVSVPERSHEHTDTYQSHTQPHARTHACTHERTSRCPKGHRSRRALWSPPACALTCMHACLPARVHVRVRACMWMRAADKHGMKSRHGLQDAQSRPDVDTSCAHTHTDTHACADASTGAERERERESRYGQTLAHECRAHICMHVRLSAYTRVHTHARTLTSMHLSLRNAHTHARTHGSALCFQRMDGILRCNERPQASGMPPCKRVRARVCKRACVCMDALDMPSAMPICVRCRVVVGEAHGGGSGEGQANRLS